ncbi:MAG: homocysteine S-methyltransferase family protein [Planctomycetota bacterium]|nr:homocysteine S-methyltransferase family protein [Planctomycetota bacterium]
MTEELKLRCIDGATGSELERRGVDLSLPLWSSRALLDAPEILADVHRDYLEAGAQAITTATFRTHRRSLHKAGLADRCRELTQQSVEIARSVRDQCDPDALVLGSVAPLEDCYRPDLAPDEETCLQEHSELMEHLMAAGVDLILIETMNQLAESRAAIEAARRVAPGQWMISFCTRSDGPPGVLLSGEPLAPFLSELADAQAVGINCVAAFAIADQVKVLQKELPGTPLLAYGNIGHADEMGNWHSSDAVDPDRYAEYSSSWIEAGATILGGCCGTTPEHIRAVVRNSFS